MKKKTTLMVRKLTHHSLRLLANTLSNAPRRQLQVPWGPRSGRIWETESCCTRRCTSSSVIGCIRSAFIRRERSGYGSPPPQGMVAND